MAGRRAEAAGGAGEEGAAGVGAIAEALLEPGGEGWSETGEGRDRSVKEGESVGGLGSLSILMTCHFLVLGADVRHDAGG